MNILKRILLFVMTAVIPTVITISVWLLSFGGFDLLSTLRGDMVLMFTTVAVVLGLWIAISIPTKDLDNMIS